MKLFKLKNVRILLLFSILSFGSQASNFNYNYTALRLSASPSSQSLEASFQYTQNMHFIGLVESKFDGDWDLAGGIGFNGPTNQLSDVYGRLLLHNVEEKGQDNLKEKYLPEFAVGSRIWIFRGVEAYGDIGILADGSHSHSLYNFGFRVHSNSLFSFGSGLRNNGHYGQQIFIRVDLNY